MNKTKKLTLLAILTVLAIILQFLPIKFLTFQFALFLFPVIVAGAVLGIAEAGFIGLASAIVILLNGDATLFLQFSVGYTVLLVIAKGVLSGVAAAWVYKLFAKKWTYASLVLSAIVAAVVNTGVFVLGAFAFFRPIIDPLGTGLWTVLISMVGINFVIELVANLVLSNAMAIIIINRNKT